LMEQNPSNLGWQRELAVAHYRVGSVLQAQGKLSEAQAAFEEYLRVSRRLADQDPGWQRELAVALVRVARVQSGEGDHSAALRLYEEASQIFATMAGTSPVFGQSVMEKETVDLDLALCRLRV
jgi:tetratricopeptide (TPR) repeat protein